MPDKTNVTQVYLSVERKVINLMLNHLDVIGELLQSGVTVDFFDEQHQPLVQAIYYTYGASDGKRRLTDDHYRSLLLEQGGKGDVMIALQVYHDCMYGVPVSNSKEDFDLLKKQLISAFVHRSAVSAMTRFNENVPKLGYVEATRQHIEDLSAAVNLTQAERSSFYTLEDLKGDYISRLESKIHEKEESFICKIPEIDEAMNVGFKAGHTTLVVGATGSHKTNFMLNLALQLYGQGANILFLPLEMDWEDFVHRVVSNITRIPYRELLNPKLLSEDKYKVVQESTMWLEQSNRFALLDVEEQISISVLRRELEKRANYFAPQVVVVDYLGLLKTESSFGQRHDLALGDLTKTLKFLGKKHGFHIITAAQLGRADIKRLREEGSEAQLDSTAVKGSQEVSADCEFIFALTKVPDEEDRLKCHVIKSRYGASGYTKDLCLDAAICQISSMEKTNVSGGVNTDVMEDVDFLKSEEEILKEIKEQEAEKSQLKPVEFASMDPDELDTL